MKSKGQQKKEEGQEASITNNSLDYADRMIEALKLFARLQKFHQQPHFTIESFRQYCIEHKWPQPKNHYWWGAFTSKASKEGIIKWTGERMPAKSAKTHHHEVKVWTGI